MASMKTYTSIFIWVVLAILVLSGCTNAIVQIPTMPMVTDKRITAYQTATATTVVATLTPLAIIPVTPPASATPFTHVVARGETMLGVAIRYGVTLEELQTANPDVDPQFLSVGTGLIIPLGGQASETAPTPTPVLIEVSDPVCYRSGDGGEWCFMTINNNRQMSVENLSAWIGLFDAGGEIVTSQVAVGPVNILRPGQAMPLIAFFPPPVPTQFVARGNLITAVEIAADNDRYLDWPLNSLTIDVLGERDNLALVTGSVEQPVEGTLPSVIWVVAIAYDQQGQVVGVRKMDSAANLRFEFVVYSLSGAIDRVEIITEIRP